MGQIQMNFFYDNRADSVNFRGMEDMGTDENLLDMKDNGKMTS